MSLQRAANLAQEATTEERIVQVLDHLGIEQAHFAARISTDWRGLAAAYPARIRSLALICPDGLDIPLLKEQAAHLLLISGDQPPATREYMDGAATTLLDAQYVILPGFTNFIWTDPVADCTEVIGSTLLRFFGGTKDFGDAGDEEVGEVAGVSYRVCGNGEPLVLLPLGIAATQWEALLPLLNTHFRTILLSGPELGFLPILEQRGAAPGYRRLVRRMIDEMELEEGETILDIGCGTGVLDRWLAHYTGRRHAIVGVDRSPYLLREAAALVARDGLEAVISLRQGDALALPFADETFDATIAVTVMEEVDADLMLKEMVRVTKAGGRIGVIVRAEDLPFFVNVPLRPDLKSKCEVSRPGGEEKGCASADLYRRFHQAGLLALQQMPDLTPFAQPNGLVEERLQQFLFRMLTPAEIEEWRGATERSLEDGSFFMTWPHHCAVGTRPV